MMTARWMKGFWSGDQNVEGSDPSSPTERIW
jgi:hypothetical protein